MGLYFFSQQVFFSHRSRYYPPLTWKLATLLSFWRSSSFLAELVILSNSVQASLCASKGRRMIVLSTCWASCKTLSLLPALARCSSLFAASNFTKALVVESVHLPDKMRCLSINMFSSISYLSLLYSKSLAA